MAESQILFVETVAAEQRKLLCNIVEHFYEAGRKVQVVADSTLGAQHIDQMLWTFSDRSFVPHRILDPGRGTPLEPVVITVGERILDGFDTVVCDAECRLDFMTAFETAVHFVIRDDVDRRLQSRRMWTEARDRALAVRHVPYASGMDLKGLV